MNSEIGLLSYIGSMSLFGIDLLTFALFFQVLEFLLNCCNCVDALTINGLILEPSQNGQNSSKYRNKEAGDEATVCSGCLEIS